MGTRDEAQAIAPVLVGHGWRNSSGESTFVKRSSETDEPLGEYPISPWSEVDEALEHGVAAYTEMLAAGPTVVANLVDRFADRLEDRADVLVEAAHAESALPVAPRLQDVELPRTTDNCVLPRRLPGTARGLRPPSPRTKGSPPSCSCAARPASHYSTGGSPGPNAAASTRSSSSAGPSAATVPRSTRR